ncbi:MAG TPA: UbiA family prenyltransferase [Chroococcales cyanobacterium]
MKSSLGRRLGIYLVEMFPLHVNVPISFFSFFGYYFLLQLLVGHHPLSMTLRSLMGALTLTAFSLLLRVFDEFKDLESDRVLFPDRPLPSGRVLTGDLKILGWGLVLLMVLLNLRLGSTPIAFSLLFLYGLLSFKYFFLPELHLRSLPLTLATHNPLAVATHLYVLAVFLDDFHLSAKTLPPAAWVAIPMFWLIVLAWETSRKIRTPEQENDYVTYSRLFGPRGAALIPMTGLTISFVLVQGFAFFLNWSIPLRAVLGLAFAVAMFGFFRWQWKQTPRNSRLRPFVEAYAMILYLTLFVEFACRYGVYWLG